MVSHKAKHLDLLSRLRIPSKAGQELLDELRARVVNVASPSCDVSDKAAFALALNSHKDTMPPIKGCGLARNGAQGHSSPMLCLFYALVVMLRKNRHPRPSQMCVRECLPKLFGPSSCDERSKSRLP